MGSDSPIKGESPFLNDYEQYINMLNDEQKKNVEEIQVANKRVPISPLTLVIITSNQGKLIWLFWCSTLILVEFDEANR